MALNEEAQSIFDSLLSEYSLASQPPQPPEETGFIPRAFQRTAQIPGRVFESYVNALDRLDHMGQTGSSDGYEPIDWAGTNVFPDLERAQSVPGKVVDFVVGDVAPQVAALAIPYVGAAKMATGLGAGVRVADLAGNVAAGAFQQAQTGNPWSVPTFAAFGALQGLPLAGRALGGAALSAGSQAIDGHDVMTREGMTQLATDTIFSAWARYPRERMSRAVDPGMDQSPPIQQDGRVFYPRQDLHEPYINVEPGMDRPSPLQRDGQRVFYPRNATENIVEPPPAVPSAETPTAPIPAVETPPISESAVTPSPKPDPEIVAPGISPDQNHPIVEASAPKVDANGQPVAPELPITDPVRLKPLKAKIEAKGEAAFIDADVFRGAVDFGRTIYQKGVQFTQWSSNMIREFGPSIKAHIENIWNGVRGLVAKEDYKRADDSGDGVGRFKAEHEHAVATGKMDPNEAFFEGPLTKMPTGKISQAAHGSTHAPDAGFVARGTRMITENFSAFHPAVQEVLTRRQGDLGYYNKLIQRAYEGASGWASKLTDRQQEIGRQRVNGIISDDEFFAHPDIPQAYKDAERKSDYAIGQLQDALLQGESDPVRRKAIQNTKGIYRARQYDIFVNGREWKRDPQAFEDTVSELVGEFGGSREAAAMDLRQHLSELRNEERFGSDSGGKTTIKSSIYEHRMLTPDEKGMKLRQIATEIDGMNSDLDQAKKANKNANTKETRTALRNAENTLEIATTKQKEIADAKVMTDARRRLYGERLNPVEIAARTGAKIITSAANSKALKMFDELHLDNVPAALSAINFPAYLDAATDAEKAVLQRFVKLDDNLSFGPLADKWVHQEVARGIGVVVPINSAFERVIRDSGIGFINSQVKQNVTLRNPATVSRNYATIPLFLLAARNFNPVEWHAALKDLRSKTGYFDEADRLGVFGATQVDHEFIESVADQISGRVRPVKKALATFKAADDFAKKIYRQPDSFVRFVTYRNSRLRGMNESQALRFTDRYTHNYGTSPKGIQIASKLPFVNPFITYNYQMFRVMKNLAEDVGNPLLSVKERMTSAAILTGLVTTPLAIKKIVESSMLSDDDKKDWDRMIRQSSPMERSQLRIPFSRNKKTGKFDFINADPFNIVGDYTKTLRNLWNRDLDAIIGDNPVGGMRSTPLLNVVAELMAGRQLFSGQPIEPNAKGAAQTVIRNMAPPLAGGYGSQELIKSFSRNNQGGRGIEDTRTGRQYTPGRAALSLVGVRIAQINPRTVERNLLFERREQQTQATRELRNITGSTRANDTKREASERYKRRLKEIQREYEPRLRRD